MSLLSTVEPRPGFRETPLDSGEGSTPEVSRDARMPKFIALPASVDPLAVFSGLRIVLVAVGAVGRVVSTHMARLGVAELSLCDPGRYKAVSTLTQLDDPADVGRPKVEVLGRLAKRVSPGTRVRTFDGPFQTLGLDAFADADLCVIATDNIRAEIELGQIALNLGKPLIHAAVHGASLTAQVRVYGNATGDGPCPACGLTSQEWDALTREIEYSCENPLGGHALNPTASTSHLCSIAGDLAVNQVVRHALRLGKDVVDQEVEFNGYTLNIRVAPLRRRPDCPVDHTRWKPLTHERPLAEATLRELARTAGLHDEGRLERASFRVGETIWVQRAVCGEGHGQTVERFVNDGDHAGLCADCREPLLAEPFYTHTAVPSRQLLARLDRPLRELGPRRPDWVLVREDGDAVLFRNAPGRGAESGGNPR